jgi:hypothetical protein
VFDYVVIAHGADPAAQGGIVNVTQHLGQLRPRFVGDQLASLESPGGAVSIRGASIWSTGWGTEKGKSRIDDSYVQDWLDARATQPDRLPEYSRGVPDSFAMAYRSIAAANQEQSE